MTNSKLLVGMMCVICAMPVWAGPGRTRDFRTNDVYSGRDDQNAVRDEQQQRSRNDVAPERNEGFGYGFERRQQQMDQHGYGGRRGRN
ncbi:MAG: hypothetical protein WC426_05700 [Sulfuriferula sp.]